MASINEAVLDIKRLDLMACGDSGIHRLDARVKVLVTAIFIVAVVSFDRYELAALLPFFLFPAVMISRSNLPLRFILGKMALLCPFVLVVGIFNPLFDRGTMIQAGGIGISGGWVSFASILVKTLLTVGATLILIGVTGFTAVCRSLRAFGMPGVFAVQLLFLYRYIFVLAEEVARAARAREFRSFNRKGLGITSFSVMIGHLLLRTWQRAERIHMAMLARGFTGALHTRRTSRFGREELCFLLGWSSLFIFLRFQNGPHLLGSLVTRIFP
ncbi:cobalt ECF transporter T component CbiQ [Geobacter sp. SVR]|uniref:cobalt ECF transporter T component CbiQ n=1 Tax=Geobacter sp. SVR TaxID=2495594 RepID=UPI00143F048C|nr:cobalt ECF transporter T component CbiQ [Geobacter sp. SVR]BCS54880.1 cobalt ECF transporter T component CbiQ [Geobacter sp. SVR]GCF87398.1 cobalt ECF transporter T component CbiQ [Geobacter sp. SVR]